MRFRSMINISYLPQRGGNLISAAFIFRSRSNVRTILRFTPIGSVPSDIMTILQTPSEILTSAYYMQGLPSHFSVFRGWPTSPNCHPVFYFLFFLFRFLPHVCLRTVFRFSLLQWCSFSYWLCNRKKRVREKEQTRKNFLLCYLFPLYPRYFLSHAMLSFSRVIFFPRHSALYCSLYICINETKAKEFVIRK